MPNLLKKIFFTPLFNSQDEDQVDGYKNIKKRKWTLLSKLLKGIAIFLFIFASLIVIDAWLNDDDYYNDDGYYDYSESECNVTGISIIGDIATISSSEEYQETFSDDVIYYLNEEEKDDNIKAVLLEIDSYGGYPVAAEEIATAIKRFNKPVVALIREYGNSAAYWVASSADIIFASRNSELGSIGVTSSYLEYTDQNQKEGVKYVELSSAKFKNTGDPDRPLNQEEKDLIMRDINILHQNFVEAVAENRNMDIEKVEELADGSTMLGQMALDNGLIDRIGVYHDVIDYLEELLGEKVEVCWY